MYVQKGDKKTIIHSNWLQVHGREEILLLYKLSNLYNGELNR